MILYVFENLKLHVQKSVGILILYPFEDIDFRNLDFVVFRASVTVLSVLEISSYLILLCLF